MKMMILVKMFMKSKKLALLLHLLLKRNNPCLKKGFIIQLVVGKINIYLLQEARTMKPQKLQKYTIFRPTLGKCFSQ